MVRKRGNNEGTIRKRADKDLWEARYTSRDGKQHSIYARTRTEVARKLADALRAQAQGLPVAPERLTVSAYIEQWLESQRLEIRESSHIHYTRMMRLHVLPTLGRLPLQRLTPHDLNQLYIERMQAGLSANSVHQIRRVLHKALHDGMRSGLIARNVVDLDKPPRLVKYRPRTFTVDEARRFLDAIREDRYYALYILAMMTGMRQGELLALTWDAIDIETGILSVRASQSRIQAQWYVSTPKSEAGNRPILLNEVCLTAVKHHRARQVEERLKIGPAWEDTTLVFPTEIGRRMVNTTFYQRRFRPLLARAGLPPIRFHDLRHTMATFMLLLGIDTTIVSRMLGHSSPSITRDVYQHVMPAMEREASDALQRLLFPDGVQRSEDG